MFAIYTWGLGHVSVGMIYGHVGMSLTLLF